MRNFNNIDILELVEKSKMEDYLYMTQEELFQEKLDADNEIIEYKKIYENTKDDLMQYFPSPSFMYTYNLKKSAVISLLINYKFINTERFNNLFLDDEEKNIIMDLITESIKRNPKISYFDLINLRDEEDEFEIYLENLIEDKVILRFGKHDNRYWKVNKL